jgi:hypothetical protein
VTGEEALFIWLESPEKQINLAAARDKARAAMLASPAARMLVVTVVAHPVDGYLSAQSVDVVFPVERTAGNPHIYEDAERMRTRLRGIGGSGVK